MSVHLSFISSSSKLAGIDRSAFAGALARLGMGSLQMSLAILAFVALIFTSVAELTLILAIAATATTLISRLIFWRTREADL